jgi:hypothetical protein
MDTTSSPPSSPPTPPPLLADRELSPQVPTGGWHKDGGHFRHFLDSPEQGLLTIVFWSDVRPRSGGTFAALDSVGVVARFLAQHPEGVHADSVQGSGYLIPLLIGECTDMVELTGDAGDVCLMHPFVLHRISGNPSGWPRFISNPAVRLATGRKAIPTLLSIFH